MGKRHNDGAHCALVSPSHSARGMLHAVCAPCLLATGAWTFLIAVKSIWPSWTKDSPVRTKRGEILGRYQLPC